MHVWISTETFAAVKLFENVVFPMLTVMAFWTQKSPGYEISVLLSSSSPTTHDFFFTDSSLSYLHQALHFLSSPYRVSFLSLLPYFTSFIITSQLFIFSFFIHVSRMHLRNKIRNLQSVYKVRCHVRWLLLLLQKLTTKFVIK